MGISNVQRLRQVAQRLHNPLSLIGLVLVITGTVTWLFTIVTQFGSRNPYLASLTVLALPAITVAGAVLTILGVRRRDRRAAALGGDQIAPAPPALTWKNPAVRQLTGFLIAVIAANVLFGFYVTRKAVDYVASPAFCAGTCHILTPEFTALQHAPHAEFDCTDCHVGGGAGSFVRAQMHGAENVAKALTKSYSLPIQTPIPSLAQGQLPCIRCHPNRDYGEKYKKWVSFDQDEGNSASRTELLLRIGGGNNASGAHGAHLAEGAMIEYRSDPSRKTIPWIRYTAADGKQIIYQTSSWSPTMAEEFELRRMNCIDCHNRVAHSFEDASGALDEALFRNEIDPRLPFIKREGMRVLTVSYANREAASQQIPSEIYEFYREQYPETSARQVGSILNASAALVAVYQRNVWPEYGVTWGLHANHAGHEDYPGCFRCHNDNQISQDGERTLLGDDCTICHAILTDRAPISLPLVTDAPLTSTRLNLPKQIVFETRAGDAKFDHEKHLEYEKGRCVACHNALFPMARAGLSYAPDVHRAAESSQTSCAGCHFDGGPAFATANHCESCHTGLSARRNAIARGPEPPSPLPEKVTYETKLGPVRFDHAKHLEEAKGECVDCHNRLFPMQDAKLQYASNLHRDAERTQTSCGGCHSTGGGAFPSADNCIKCHAGLGEPRATPNSGVTGIPKLASFETRLGPARFDHQKHVDEAEGNCQACHNRIFPLAKGLLNYKDNLHKTAETAKTACGACHYSGGEAFESKGNCLRCHREPSIQARGSELGLPKEFIFENRLGNVSFDHDQHIANEDGKCTACHDRIWPMGEVSLAGYSDDYHRVAEARGAFCAACHASGNHAFATLNNCVRCHEGLAKVTRANP